jgi:Tfp pilus assembly protein PilO
LALIDQAAVKQKLILNRGDYKYSKAKQSQISDGFNLSKYEIVLPVTGQYTQIRQFIAQVLQLQPALALSDFKMTRENSLSPNVEATLVFVLFLQSELNVKSELK